MLPNKVVSIQESILWKLPYILDELKRGNLGALELFEKVSANFEDVNEFLMSLDVLYILKMITYSEEYGVFEYAARD